MKAGRIIIGLIVLAIFAIAIAVGFAGNKGPSKSWRPSYAASSDKPFGSKVLFENLEEFLEADTLITLNKGPFDTLAFGQFGDHILMMVADSYRPEDYKVEEVLRFAAEGNDVFLASSYFPETLLRELGVGLDYYYLDRSDSLTINMTGSQRKYKFSSRHCSSFFSYWSKQDAIPIAQSADRAAIALQVQYGKGSILLSSHPFAFTNYYLLRKPELSYVEEVLSYLPTDRTVFWDGYYKPDRPASSGENPPPQSNNSPSLWEYIQQHEALKWAFYILMAGSLAYVLLGGKRRQRLVPIIEPLRNSTLEFTETIGRLYLFEKNKKTVGEKHKLMAEKRIRVFLEHIRSKYNLKTNRLDTAFEKTLAAKTEMEEKEVRVLLRRIKQVQEQEDILAETLVQLSNEIENFYQRNGR